MQARHAVSLYYTAFAKAVPDSPHPRRPSQAPIAKLPTPPPKQSGGITATKKYAGSQSTRASVQPSVQRPPASPTAKDLALSKEPQLTITLKQTPVESQEYRSTGQSWMPVYQEFSSAIAVRHYSPKTLKAYTSWTRRLQSFTKSVAPSELSMSDVKAFLTFLAVEKQVSASSQNQAFNALLFLFTNAR
jgi:hypothetical protein